MQEGDRMGKGIGGGRETGGRKERCGDGGQLEIEGRWRLKEMEVEGDGS